MSLISSFFGAAFFFIFTAAYAYVPEAEYIFKELTKSNRFISLKIDQKRVLFSKGYEGGKAEFTEEIFLKYPWKYARKTVYQGKTRLTVYDGTNYLFLEDGKWFEPKEKYSVPFIYGIYLCRDKDELSAFLSKRGIIPYLPVLSRKDGLLGILFSSQDKERLKVWFDREIFFPIAFSMKGEGNGKDTEYAYSDLRKSEGAPYFPMKMTKKYAGELSEQIEVTTVLPGEKFSPTLFDISYLKKRYPKLETGKTSDYQE